MGDTAALLKKLQIKDVNPGTCTGPDGWITEPGADTLVSTNPTTGQPIASVLRASTKAAGQVVSASAAAFATWRDVPAPKRGDVVRDLGSALREMKEPLEIGRASCRERVFRSV